MVVSAHLATTLLQMGQGPESAARRRHIVDIRKRTLGPENPATLHSLENLAHTLRDIDELPEAEAICEELLATRIRVLPADHPDIVRTRELRHAIDQDVAADP